MAEPRYRVAPLSTEWLTIAPAMQLIAEWMVNAPEQGAPAITISKSEASEPPRILSLATPCARTVLAKCGHPNNWHERGGGCTATGCACSRFVPPQPPQPPPTPEQAEGTAVAWAESCGCNHNRRSHRLGDSSACMVTGCVCPVFLTP